MGNIRYKGDNYTRSSSDGGCTEPIYFNLDATGSSPTSELTYDEIVTYHEQGRTIIGVEDFGIEGQYFYYLSSMNTTQKYVGFIYWSFNNNGITLTRYTIFGTGQITKNSKLAN